MTTLLIDGHNLLYRCIHSVHYVNAGKCSEDQIFDLWKHSFLNSIFSSIIKFNANEVVVAVDSSNSWRYNVYPLYKANRKAKRKESKINFDKFLPIAFEYIQDIKNTFTTIKFVNVDQCEGDDIIGVLSKKIFDDKIIISSDKDLHQLINPHCKQYDAMQAKFIQCLNPALALVIKCVMGDMKSDCIPAIYPRCGAKTAAKIIEEGLDDFLSKDETHKKNYERNCILIDLGRIPNDLQENIYTAYEEYPKSPIDRMKIMKFFVMNQLQKLMGEWNGISNIIKGLK